MSLPNIALVHGGFTDESIISNQSAQLIAKSLDSQKFRVFMVEVLSDSWKVSESNGDTWDINKSDFSFHRGEEHLRVDAVVNTIHGTPGEDGKMQGYFDMLGIPYNNSGVLSSSLSFNKGFCNAFLSRCGIKVAESVFLLDRQDADPKAIIKQLGLPCFVKPNDAGSSLGVSKVKSEEDLIPAIDHAFSIGNKVLIESFIEGTEITCGVVRQDGKPTSVAVTEIVFEADFFDYNAKYLSNQTQEITPARIDEKDYQAAMKLSEQIYKLLDCKGFFRADYILKDGELYLIEVNTVPGMSEKSLMPQMLEYLGLDLRQILEEQIDEMLTSA